MARVSGRPDTGDTKMANKVEYVRQCFPLVETQHGKGLRMTIEVTRYDGMINVNGAPVSDSRYNSALSALRFIAQALEELEASWTKQVKQKKEVEDYWRRRNALNDR